MLALKDALALFQKCNRLHEALKDKHLLLVARIQSIANMIERLPALFNPNLYRIFAFESGEHIEVSNSQLKVLESTWQAVHESMYVLDMPTQSASFDVTLQRKEMQVRRPAAC